MGYEEGRRYRVAGRIIKINAKGRSASWCSGRMLVDDGHGGARRMGFAGCLADGCREGAGVVMDADYIVDPTYGPKWSIPRNSAAYPAPLTYGEFRLACLNDERLKDLPKAAMEKLWAAAGSSVLMEMRTDAEGLCGKLKLGTQDASRVKGYAYAGGPAGMIRGRLPHMPQAHAERIADALVKRTGNVQAANAYAYKQLQSLADWAKHGEGDDDPFGTLCGSWDCPFPVADLVFLEDLGGGEFSPCRIRRILWAAMAKELQSLPGSNCLPVSPDAGSWVRYRAWQLYRSAFLDVKVAEGRKVPDETPDGLDLTSDAGFSRFVEDCAAAGDYGVAIEETVAGILSSRWLYTDRMLYSERLCAKLAAGAAASPSNRVPPRDMPSWDVLDDSQKAAVRTALKPSLSCVTGGPGTGKTRTLGALVEAWKALFGDGSGDRHKIMVLAPTGKAANKAKSATGCACAGTIDRLFAKNGTELAGFGSRKQFRELAGLEPAEREIDAVSSGTFEVSPTSLVIVDEASMIDVEKAGRLLKLVHGCTIVFAGDVDQLPPIEPGAFFRECIDSHRIATAKLSVNHRAKTNRALPAAADKIRLGQELSKFDFSNFNPIVSVREDRMDLALMIADDAVVRPDGRCPAEDIVVSEYRRLLAGGADPRDIMVMAPYHEAGKGRVPRRLYVDRLNALLQDVVNPPELSAGAGADKGTDAEGTWKAGRGQMIEVYDCRGRQLRIGDRIMNLKNDQDLKWEQYEGYDFLSGKAVAQPYKDNVGVFNGESGVVRRMYVRTANASGKGKPCRVLVELDDLRSKAEQAADPRPPKWLVAEASEYRIYDEAGNRINAWRLDNWELGYAMTIHKAQGCEAPHVIIALSEAGRRTSPQGFLTRNLLYTALTRSSGSCLVVGTLEFLNQCAATPAPGDFIELRNRIKAAVPRR